jgi:hypothetical protein
MMMEKLVELLAEEPDVLRENLTQCSFVQQKLHMLPGCEPGPQRWEASDKPLELRHGLTSSNCYHFKFKYRFGEMLGRGNLLLSSIHGLAKITPRDSVRFEKLVVTELAKMVPTRPRQ